jgi:ankyrin repeat protein
LVAKLLLARDDADAFITDNRGQTPLFRAAKKGHETAVKVLLAQSSNIINQVDTIGRTPLSVAVAHRHERIVNCYLRRDKAQ